MKFKQWLYNEIDWDVTWSDVEKICWDTDKLVEYLNDVISNRGVKTKKRKKFPSTLPFIHSSSKLLGKEDIDENIDINDFIEQITKKPNNVVDPNDKMLKSGMPNEFVYKTGIPALRGIVYDIEKNKFFVINTCPGAGECALICYSRKNNYIRYPESYDSMTRSLNYMLNYPDEYENMLYEELKEKCIEHGAKTGYEPKVLFRWNDSGDFFSKRYRLMAYRVMKKLTSEGYNIADAAYTKVADAAYTKVADAVNEPNYNQKKMKSKNLNKAKKEKNDEFYTQLSDIENELKHYKKHFKNKVVYCNCDDPKVSNFFHYFSYNFEKLGLKKLMATCYKSQINSDKAIYCEYTGDKNSNNVPDLNEIKIHYLKGDGDFRSKECIEFLKQADIVVTNPPFSLFREYVAQLVEYNKKFLIIGHQNAITYKEIFPLIKDNKIWLGHGFKGGAAHFINKHYEDYATATDRKEGMIRVSGVHWFTNLEHEKRNEDLILYKKYDPKEYSKYDNYDAINVNKTKDIPMDYKGAMGVPITFMDKYNPDQFEIIGSNRGVDQDPNGVYGRGSYLNGKETFKRLFIKNKKL